MNYTLTDWFPGYIKPVRPGWFQTMVGSVIGYSYWSGKQWSNQRSAAGGHRSYDYAEQYKRWRGILK